MTDPMSMQLVATAITEAARTVGGEGGKQVWSSLTGLVRRVFGHDSPLSSAVVAVEADPSDEMQRGFLAGSLAARAQTDPTFATELSAWVEMVTAVTAPRTGAGHVTNTIGSGARTGNVVQARDIHGPVTSYHRSV